MMPEMPAEIQDELNGVSPDDRWEYVGYKLLMMEQAINRIEQKMNVVGQNVTNINAFCDETRAAVEKMSGNPLIRGMLPRPAPRPIPGLITPQ